jgi:preprotein translocase subunit SecD
LALASATDLVRERLQALGIKGFRVTAVGDRLVVDLPAGPLDARAQRDVAKTAQLAFYDWEANALTPNGETVASQLLGQDETALLVSEGGATGPGSPDAGGVPLYDAVELASKQPPRVSLDNTRHGAEYYMFGAPASASCVRAAGNAGTQSTPGVHCLLSGPDDTRHELLSGLPSGVSASAGTALVIPPGTVVIQATDASSGTPTKFSDPAALFYVLRDHASMTGKDITDPLQSTDAAGSPDVAFSFTPQGKSKFQHVTAMVAHRGAFVSGVAQTLYQHFAVALDNKLVTVASIDFRAYPDGIQSGNGVDIAGNFTVQSAQDLASQIRHGGLPLHLSLVTGQRRGAGIP